MRPLLFILLILLFSACSSDSTISIQFPEGGYEFPSQISEQDHSLYMYPIKDVLSTKDSFVFATYSEPLFQSFDEPNLSLTSPEQPIFRLLYEPGGTRYTAILTLQQNKLIVKEPQTGCAIPDLDVEMLDSLEKEHHHLLSMHFPINEYKGTSWRKKYLDSQTKKYPQLLQAVYYKSLRDKMSTQDEEKFTYRKREIPLSDDKYRYFVTKINQSGYWKQKPIVQNCIGQATHQSAITLEAAIPSKYNFVTYMVCNDDSSKLAQIYQELIQFSKIDQNEEKWHEQMMK